MTRALTEKQPFSRSIRNNFFRRRSKDFHNTSQLLDLVLAGEERIAGEELSEYTPEAPHVDGRAIGQTEDDFRGAIKPRLDVRVDALMRVTRATEIDDFDRAAAALFQQHILRFEITVYNIFLVKQPQTLDQRMGKSSD